MFLNRRRTCSLGRAILLVLLLPVMVAACTTDAIPETPAATEKATDAPATEAPATDAPATDAPATDAPATEEVFTLSEAPMLAEMVSAGDLPSVEERLPTNPLIVEPVESIGQYGGTWHRAFLGEKDFHALGRLIYESVIRWPRDPSDPLQPGMAERWEWNDKGTELTLYFREGLKWSDGEPFTVDDVVFWWENIENDTNITASPHAEWVTEGEPMELVVVDDITLTLKFSAPNGLAETVGLAFHGCQWPLGFENFGFFAPRHYLEQFHPTYNDEATYDDFKAKAFNLNPDLPVMYAWKVTEFEAGGTEMIAERNPYYWKTDPTGQQLPYIDRIHFALVEDNEAINNMALAGDIDMQHRRIDFSKYTLFQENAEAGDYRTFLWTTANASNITLFPNQSFGDVKYRELMQNLSFRQALSLAIDRASINKVSYLDQGIPRTITVVRDSALFQEDLENYYGEFDPDKAEELLVEVGLVKGDDGIYTFADGSPVELTVEGSDSVSGGSKDTLEMVVEGWTKIGLKATLTISAREIFWDKANGNQVMISSWETDRGLVPMVDPIYQIPFDMRSWMGPAFGTWYNTGGKDGEEPTGQLRDLQILYDEYRATVDSEKQLEIALEIVKMTTENLNVIGTVGMSPALTVVKNNFHNVMESFTSDWIIFTPGTMDPPQYWIEE
ncbi:MAG: hypothetical protein JXB07_21235 [Anaerolineae bacterium]|nr:hypothetical protein [Anaerolineae bacterium]